MSNLGNLTIQLKLDIRPYAAAMKSAIAMAQSFKTSSKNLLKLDAGKMDTSKIDSELKKLDSTLKTYDTSSRKAGGSSVKLSKDLDGLSVSTGTVKRSFVEAASQMAIFAAGIYLVATRVARVSYDMLKLGGDTAAVESSFRNLTTKAGLDANKFMQDLKKNTAGAVSEMKLMQTVAKGKFLGVDIESMPELLKFATIRAKEMGVETDYLVDSIITGLGRKSPLILDNLGLTMAELDAEVIKVAESHGKLITKVDEQTRSMYLTEAAVRVAKNQIEESSLSLDDNAFVLEKTTAGWEDLKASISKTFSDVVFDRINKFNSALEFTGTTAEDASISISSIAAAIIEIGTSTSVIFMLIDALDFVVSKAKEVNLSFDEMIFFLSMTPPGNFLGGIVDMLRDAYNWADKLLNKTATLGVPDAAIYPLPPPGFKEPKRTKTFIPTSGHTGRSGNTQREQTEKEILSILEQERKKLAELKKEYELNADSLLAQLETYEKILKVEERIYELQFGPRISNIPFQKLPPLDRWTPEEYPGRAKADIISTERFKAANLMLGELGNTLNDSLSKAWEDSFGKADNLAANFIRSIISKLIQGMINNAVSSLMNSIFPGAGVVIPSVFGGGGASPAGMPGGDGMNPPAGMPGAGGFMGRAPIVNNVNNVSQPPINVNIQANVPFDTIVAKGMPGYQLKVNQTKVK